MVYNHQAKAFTIDTKQLEFAAMSFMYAIKHIRRAAGLPLDKYKNDKAMESPDFAMKGIIDGAKALGIEPGAEFGEQIDVRDC